MNSINNIKAVSAHLPLSHMVYKDGEIDTEKAEKLVVLHYPLAKSYKWREWEQQLDEQLSNRFYPYLMRSYHGEFGLFVALSDESEVPPKICNGDGVEVIPQRVRYAQDLNPIWIRLIMRKVRAFGAHCQGSHTLGRPILQVDAWSGKSGGGINAISLDCRTQMLKGGGATEVVLFHENIPLREAKTSSNEKYWRGSEWMYSKNSVLMRWLPRNGEKPPGPVYREIRKNKNKRTQRAFIDITSAKALEKSWPYILKPVQDEFIREASEYGFDLQRKVLNLRPLPLKTKYRSSPTKSSFSSLSLDKAVDVIDLRVSDSVSSEQIVSVLQGVLDKKKMGATLSLMPPVAPEDIDGLNLNDNQRVLVLLDQTPNIVGDRYPLTRSLRTKVACQHINVNPHDLASDSVEKNLLTEQKDEDGNEFLVLQAGSDYYDYSFDLFDKKDNKKALERNVEIVVKELELKSLLLNREVKISESLPEQSSLLNDQLIVITDGYLFTVISDRPVLLPFDPSNPDRVALCDRVLSNFGLSVAELLASLQKDWPYNYRPEVVMQGFGSPAEKLSRFARRLTFVINSSVDGVSVMFQDPKYETPHMIPEGLEETRDKLNKQESSLSLRNWLLPEIDTLHQALVELREEGVLTQAAVDKLSGELDGLSNYWKDSLRELLQDGIDECTYRQIKKSAFEKWLAKRNQGLSEDERKATVDTNLISIWDELTSRVTGLPLKDVKGWLRNVPGIHRLWCDEEQHYFIVGSIVSPKAKISRQPSIRQWHCLKGQFNPELITALVDVDWVRMNQLAGNPCVATLIKRWRECQSEPDQALGEELLTP